MRELSALELAEYLREARPAPLLLDVREPWEFEKAHIEGSELVPMRELGGQLHRLDPEREIVVICHHGVRSRMVCYMLQREGFGRVINLAGGVDAWARDVDCHMPTY